MPEISPSPSEAVPSEPIVQTSDTLTGSAPASGGRQAFRDIKRQLSAEELSNPGVQKLILEMLAEVEEERNDLKAFQQKFYDADKRCAVLEEQSRRNSYNEVLFTVGVGVGGTIIGLAPTFWTPNVLQGVLCLIVGIFLVGGAAVCRIFYK